MSNNADVSKVVCESQVKERRDILSTTIGEIRRIICTLETSLTPILRDPEAKVGPDGAEPSLVPMAYDLFAFNRELRDAENHMQSIIDRMEL